MQEKIVGIIGGMGPEATVDLMKRVIKATPASDDGDHIRMLVDNNPKVPSRIKALLEGNGESPVPCLLDMARRLTDWGADFLAMPCNTAHYYHRDIQNSVTVPVLDMIQLAVQAVKRRAPGLERVGLLASTAVLRLKLYERAFAENNIAVVTPADMFQSNLMRAIKRIKTGDYGNEVVETIQAAADNLLDRGSEALLVACTEISIVAGEIRTTAEMFDSAQILAEEIINRTQPCCSEEEPAAQIEQITYSDDGVDVTLIRWMLSLTPSERLQVLQQNVQSLARLCNESSFT